MAANYDELVGRLEATHLVPVNANDPKYGRKFRTLKNPNGPEAAAAIRDLEGERDSWKAAREKSEEVIRLIVGAAGERPADLDIIEHVAALLAARQSAEAKLADAVRLLAILSDEAAVKHGDPHAAQAARAFLASLDKEKAGG